MRAIIRASAEGPARSAAKPSEVGSTSQTALMAMAGLAAPISAQTAAARAVRRACDGKRVMVVLRQAMSASSPAGIPLRFGSGAPAFQMYPARFSAG